MTLPIVRNPMVFNNLQVTNQAVEQQEVQDGYARTLAHMIGLNGSELNMVRVYGHGGQLVCGPDRFVHESFDVDGSTAGGVSIVELGGVYNYFELMMLVNLPALEFSTDGTNFKGRTYPTFQGTDDAGPESWFGIKCWATCTHLRISTLGYASTALWYLSAWKL